MTGMCSKGKGVKSLDNMT